VAVAEALTLAHDTGEHYSLAELYRIQGELLIRQPDERPEAAARAEHAFAQALAIAREQQAKSYEQRVLASLDALRLSR
jgi:predicted ATPase